MILYSEEESWRSSAIPAIFALPMLGRKVREARRLVLTCWHSLGPVHVGEQVHDPDVWQQAQVDLADKLLLFLLSPEDLLADFNMVRVSLGALKVLLVVRLHGEEIGSCR